MVNLNTFLFKQKLYSFKQYFFFPITKYTRSLEGVSTQLPCKQVRPEDKGDSLCVSAYERGCEQYVWLSTVTVCHCMLLEVRLLLLPPGDSLTLLQSLTSSSSTLNSSSSFWSRASWTSACSFDSVCCNTQIYTHTHTHFCYTSIMVCYVLQSIVTTPNNLCPLFVCSSDG